MLHDLGLPTIINMFCERGKAFNSENFKRDMASKGIKPLVYLKLYNALMDWKIAASDVKENQNPSPALTENSRSSSDIDEFVML